MNLEAPILVRISDLKTNPKNPRLIKDDRFRKLVQSLKDFPEMLEKRPIVVNEDMVVLGGNMRLKAAKEAGMKELPVIIAKGWTQAQQDEFVIKDNVGFGEWDWQDLQLNWDVPKLEDWGLELPEIKVEDPEAHEDDFEIPEQVTTSIVLGDIIEIGRHRLMCGDSTDSDAVGKLMNGEKADIVFTSPPYNAGSLDISGNKGTQKKYNSFDDNKTENEYFDFLSSNINALIPHTEEIFYNIGIVENSKRVINRVLFTYNAIFKDIIYWNKSTVAPHIQSGVINNKVEFILCFGDGKRKFKNAQFPQGSYWNVIEGKNASGNEFANIHKATFPIYLPENIISNFSRKGSVVVDSFLGTGTTMVASHQLNRICYGMELDPKYCQVIIDRMLKLDPNIEVRINGEKYHA